MLVPNRHGSSNSYRYGFNEMEKDDELKGDGNSYDFGARMLDPRVGRWFSPDSKEKSYPGLSPYSFTNNNPILYVDFEGKDFGIKINHEDKTIVIVSNVYTVSESMYKQALAGAKQWNDLKNIEVDGYKVSFDIKVHKPSIPSDNDVIDNHTYSDRPDLTINFKDKKVELKESKLNKYRDMMTPVFNFSLSYGDIIGNLYNGKLGGGSNKIASGVDKFAGGWTDGKSIVMNTHEDLGDLGGYSDLVAHEIGHLFGLGDPGKKYFSPKGIMQYSGLYLSSPSIEDVKNILQYAKDFLSPSGTEKDAKVTILENIGESDGANPVGIRGEEPKK